MKIKRFQMGGEMAPQEQMPQEQGMAPQGGGPEEQIMAMAQQVIEQLGPEAAAMLAQVIMEMLQAGAAPQGSPAYAKKGGKLVMIGRR